MSTVDRGVLREQIDCLVCDKVAKLEKGLCFGCYIDLHYTWAICEPEPTQMQKVTSIWEAITANHRSLLDQFMMEQDIKDGEGWKYRKKRDDQGYVDDYGG